MLLPVARSVSSRKALSMRVHATLQGKFTAVVRHILSGVLVDLFVVCG